MELIQHRFSGRRSTRHRSSSSSPNDPHDPPPLPMLSKIAGATVFVMCLLLQVTAAGLNQLTQDKRPGLICWTCSNKSSNEECNDWAPNVKCQRNQTLCKTTHRLDPATEHSLSVSKFCASVDECRIDRLGCRSSSSSSLSSLSSRRTSQVQQLLECESCCDSSYCNEDVPNNDTAAKFMSMAILSAQSSASSVQYCPPAMSSPSWTTILTIALTIIALFNQHLQPLSKRQS